MYRTVIQDRWPPVTRRRKPGRARLRREAPNATTGRTGLGFSRAMRDEPMQRMLATVSKDTLDLGTQKGGINQFMTTQHRNRRRRR